MPTGRIDGSLEGQSKSLYETRASERQVGGDHYRRLKIQPWDALQVWMSQEQFEGYLLGNCIKYLARKKGGMEDLQKAQHCLEKLIEVRGSREEGSEDKKVPVDPAYAAYLQWRIEHPYKQALDECRSWREASID